VRVVIAVVAARLYVERHLVFGGCAAALLAGVAAARAPVVPLVLCSLFGIVIALAQTRGRVPILDRCELSAPLFGRELARALALVPCVAAAIAALAATAGQLVRGVPLSASVLTILLAAPIASALVALSATIRRGWPRVLYVALAGGTSAAAYALAVSPGSLLVAVAFCGLASYVALRQYGEALARYDPIDD
jgi:hypothetical protein